MTKRKSFNITQINNENIINLQKKLRENGNMIQQASIINLAIELFFRNKDTELIDIMKTEHIL